MDAERLSQDERTRKQKSRQAIALAQNGQWQEALDVNRSLRKLFPKDPDTLNRLGEAFSKLDSVPDANDAFESAAKSKQDRAENTKRAILLARQTSWQEAVKVNADITADFPWDLEAYNRLGKAFSELGKFSEAKNAFECSIALSPNNVIAQKNLERVSKLLDQNPCIETKRDNRKHSFIEDGGKTGVTILVDLASSDTLMRLAPGHSIELQVGGSNLTAMDSAGEYIGKLPAKLSSRLSRLINGGNRYEATITSVGGNELTILIREVYVDPSQVGMASFPQKDHTRGFPPVNLPSYQLNELESVMVKDWTDDDTEPGDDEAFSPVIHRIISPGESLDSDDPEAF